MAGDFWTCRRGMGRIGACAPACPGATAAAAPAAATTATTTAATTAATDTAAVPTAVPAVAPDTIRAASPETAAAAAAAPATPSPTGRARDVPALLRGPDPAAVQQRAGGLQEFLQRIRGLRCEIPVPEGQLYGCAWAGPGRPGTRSSAGRPAVHVEYPPNIRYPGVEPGASDAAASRATATPTSTPTSGATAASSAAAAPGAPQCKPLEPWSSGTITPQPQQSGRFFYGVRDGCTSISRVPGNGALPARSICAVLDVVAATAAGAQSLILPARWHPTVASHSQPQRRRLGQHPQVPFVREIVQKEVVVEAPFAVAFLRKTLQLPLVPEQAQAQG